MLRKQIYPLLKSRVFQHLAFWLFAYVLLAGFFAKEYGGTFLKLNMIYTGLFIWSIILIVYINLLLLIPRFLQKRKWWIYLFSMMILIGLGIMLNLLTFDHLSDWLFPGFYFISYYEVRDIFNFVVIFLATTTLLKLAKGWFELSEQRKQINRLEREKLDAELQALKTQINPHFLFNSLNSMYALSLDKDEKVPDLLLKLASGMRYMLYETNENFVPLEKELEYLQNYLDLQRLRTDHRADIRFKIEGVIREQKLVPLVFIPFVENAFKHGIKGDIESVFIDIFLKVEKERLCFEVTNNKGQVDEVPGIASEGGVGLNNVKKRLKLLYGKQYDLIINETSSTYQTILKIPV